MLITLSQEKRVRKMHGNDPGSGQNAPGFFLAQKTSDASGGLARAQKFC